jgi:OOP family OmpA-OmpF porin
MKKYSLLALTLMIAFLLGAQNKEEKINNPHASNYRDWAISLGFGNTYMSGDLQSYAYNPATDSRDDFTFGPTGYVSVTKYISSVWGFSLGTDFGTMGGTYRNGIPSFEGLFINFYPQVVVNLSALALKGKQYDRKWSHLIKLGIGGYYGLPELTYRKADGVIVSSVLDGDGDENWNNSVAGVFDYNLKYRLTKALDLDLQVGARVYTTDNIDGFGEGFPAYSINPSNRSNDRTFYTGLGITYNFGNKGEAETNDKLSVIYTNPLDDLVSSVEEIRESYEMLTGDDDDDGVSNLFDKDNATPEGATVNGSGIASDVDGDGIPDYLDEDPFTIKGAKVDAQGRAIDSDGDGIADVMDKEPGTEKGTLVNFEGKTIPGGIGAKAGSSAFIPSVFFDFNSATVTSANHYRMVTIARILMSNEKAKINLQGYTDKRGPENYNMKLGQRRAEEVKKQLVQVYGVDESRITTESKGEQAVFAEGRYDVNRRVDVILK